MIFIRIYRTMVNYTGIITIVIMLCFSLPNCFAQKKLNIVLIVTDDQGAQAGYLGTPGLKTPAMDSLARSGVAFSKAYCTFPSCSPSRAGILTGTYPHVNGIITNVYEYLGPVPPASWIAQTASHNNQFHVNDTITTLIEMLKSAGYYTGITGKFHLAPHKKFSFDFWSKDFNKKEIGTFFFNAGENPFFLAYNSTNPHRPFNINTFPSAVANKRKEGKLKVPSFLPNTPLMKNDWAEYLTAIESADKDVANVLQMLKEREMEGNTLIIFLGDNGAPFHRGKYSPYNMGNNCPLIISGPGIRKNVFSDLIVSFVDIMPTILDMVNIDIPPSVNGKSLKPFLMGQSENSVHDFVVTETAFPRPKEPNYQVRSLFNDRFVYIRSNGRARVKLSPEDMYEQKGWGNHSYQATIEAKNSFPIQYRLLETLENTPPVEEMFDLHSDPWCMNDISKNPAFEGQLERMRKNLDLWIIDTNDREMLKLLNNREALNLSGVSSSN